MGAREVALERLWRHALRDIRVRHPDPRVHVSISVRPAHEAVRVTFDMYGLRDTTSEGLVGDYTPGSGRRGFHADLLTSDWPGVKMARMAAIGAWVAYINHEALELVTVRTGQIFYDPHDHPSSPAQAMVNRAGIFTNDRDGLKALACFAFDRLMVNYASVPEVADRELEIEEAWVRDGEIGG